MTPAAARRRPPARLEIGLLAAAATGGAAECRLFSGAGDHGPGGWASVIGVAVVGYGVTSLLLRTRLPRSIDALGGGVATALAAAWLASLQVSGPHGGLGGLGPSLRAARPVVMAFHLPLPVTPGTVVLAGVIAGMAGTGTRLLLTRPGLALVPALVLVTGSSVALGGVGAGILAGVFVVIATVTLASGGRTGTVGAAGAGGLALASILLIGLPIASAVGTAGGRGIRSPTIRPTSLSLETDLIGVERRDAAVTLFSTESPVTTYWQVGVLTRWQGNRWLPSPAAGPLPTTVAGRDRFRASVTIADLASRLLPVPPGILSTSVAGAEVRSGEVVGPSVTRPGQHYQVSAVDHAAGSLVPATAPATAPSSSLATAPPSEDLLPYLSLGSVPAEVVSLARAVTTGAGSPLAEAELLVDWFRSSRFHYSLDPAPPPKGVNPLGYFLTDSRTGTCESFAGAFAVMARSLGLPARVAVGFTAGRPEGGGRATITGADAHAWPEVYLGPASGWVSFEPTPSTGSGSLTPSDVIGPTAVSLPTVRTISPTTPTTAPTTPTTAPTIGPPTPGPATSPTASTPSTSPRSPSGPGAGWPPVATALALAGALGLAGALALAATRLVQKLLLRRASPADRIVAAYRSAERAVGRTGSPRPPSRSPSAHAGQLETPAGPYMERLAHLLELAAFSPEGVSDGTAAEAEIAAGRVERLARGRPARAPV